MHELAYSVGAQWQMFQLQVITNKLAAIRVICFPVLSRKGYKKPQELQVPTYMPHLSVADIRISFLFEENVIIFYPGTTKSFLRAALSPSMSSSFEWRHLELFHLFSPFKWRILIRAMSKTLLKIVACNDLLRHHFSNSFK